MRHIHQVLPLAFLCVPLSCAAAMPAAAEAPVVHAEDADRRAAEEADAQESAAAAPADRTQKVPRLDVWGDYRWLYGKACMEMPSVRQKRDVFLSTRRFRIAPTVHLGGGWSVGGMLEDIRYDKDTIAGAPSRGQKTSGNAASSSAMNGTGQSGRAVRSTTIWRRSCPPSRGRRCEGIRLPSTTASTITHPRTLRRLSV